MRVMHWIWTNDFDVFLGDEMQYQTVILKVRMKGKKSGKKVTKILQDMDSEWVCVVFESVQRENIVMDLLKPIIVNLRKASDK